MGLRRVAFVLTILVFGAMVGTPARALPDVFVISGTVLDPFGDPLPGAHVTDGAGKLALTDASGSYRIQELGFGCYTLVASKIGMVSPAPVDVCLTVLSLNATADFLTLYVSQGLTDRTYYSTAAGPAMLTYDFETYAPNPGAPGESHASCVFALDSRVGIEERMVFEESVSGKYRWTITKTLPAGSQEGTFQFTGSVKECRSGRILSRPSSAAYVIDNSPPMVDDPGPEWITSDGSLSVRAIDALSGIAVDKAEIFVDDSLVPGPYSYPFESGRLGFKPNGLTPGSHLASLRVKDRSLNESTLSFEFKVDIAPPVMGMGSPEGKVSSRSPKLVVPVADYESGLDPATVLMTVSNGILVNNVAARFDHDSQSIVYEIPEGLEGPGLGQMPLLDGRYTVTASIVDIAGNYSNVEWSFVVWTLPTPPPI